MFDIGFAEFLLIGVVALVVIGPERLPETIRTVSAYVNRIRRSVTELKNDVARELHNDEVMRELRDSAKGLKDEFDQARTSIESEIGSETEGLSEELRNVHTNIKQTAAAAEPETELGGPSGIAGNAGAPQPDPAQRQET
ncbi:twin arginine-targeting protein translocase TatB, putative [Luminiphilus syltensis NOR5-1B]|uniref:Sec-independent protein translocase protein TatB n=1 Tax=Luminiphilus syltensis NOR5-1B TaxID=565045 RepID=B8KUR8_9GAMM|nr:Sec-independent protein translocase protein TatB [Luminiphilus syltensis]EED34080.1 twin arginine-targeting protein translocase TatB, putative [Luminiphilus syltensis NOR5-1B]